MDELRAIGEVPYLIPLGGSTPLGAAAYAAAVPELAAQLGGQQVTHLVVAAGSLGTMASLILGTWASGLDYQVHGYTVLWPQAEAITRLEELLEETRRQYFPAMTARPNCQILGSQLGAGYGAPTAAGREAAGWPPATTACCSTTPTPPKPWPGSSRGSAAEPTPPRPGRVLPHRGADGIFRSHGQRRLTAPTPATAAPTGPRQA